MSELRIALVAEGPTDAVTIEAALKAILPDAFVLTRLQPEATRPEMGTGWCGVFKWCRDFAARVNGTLEQDPTLQRFDLFILHLDADVAEKAYGDGGAAVLEAADGMLPLPCSRPCPPPSDTIEQLRQRLMNWLALGALGPRTVLCIPSKASEAWLASAVLPPTHSLLGGIECNVRVEAALAQLPKAQRLRKNVREYRQRAQDITAKWADVRSRCAEARQFEGDVHSAAQNV